jgi:hypothetical protein
VFDPAERAKALAERRASRTRVAVTRGYGDFWQGASIDRGTLARYLPSLLDTADELKAVARKLGAAPGDVHLGSDATEATVKRVALADYRVVYFATHGLVAGDVEGLAEPSLALTLPKQPTELDDGLLTASEVAQLKLNADWVVLSACNTAAADKPGAEALSGLARAFFYAEARALLVSHWSVDSEAATRLTTSTFALMKADPKLGRAAALREAMLSYMNDKGSPLDAYPGFWGHFPSSERERKPPRLPSARQANRNRASKPALRRCRLRRYRMLLGTSRRGSHLRKCDNNQKSRDPDRRKGEPCLSRLVSGVGGNVPERPAHDRRHSPRHDR